MHRREFLQALALASISGSLTAPALASNASPLYRLPERKRVASLIHLTDCHAQLLPVHHREPSINIGVGESAGRPQHLTGEALLRHYGLRRGSRLAHAFTHLDFEELARRYGKMGGFAHLATLVKSIQSQRQGAILVDGGDSWQGSAAALWTRGADMVAASKLLGVKVMTGHWEFTLGAERVMDLIQHDMLGSIDFIAHNVFTRDFGDRVFSPFIIKEIDGMDVAIIGQAYPYTPIANPQHLIPDWTFGIHEQSLRETINEVRRFKVAAIVLLSHNGVDVDLKLASRVEGLTAILGGHTHDPLPKPIRVKNNGGETLVANAGSNGKFIGVLDIFSSHGKTACDYSLMPVFSGLLEPDTEMTALVARIRQPFERSLGQVLAVTDDLLYRRGNFNGSLDEIILGCLQQSQDAEIAVSPGFRWGTTLLPGSEITVEDVMAQTAITYPGITVRNLTGAEIKDALEDIADNLFNPDPYYRQGGDMVRTGGLSYTCIPRASIGKRIENLRIDEIPMDADRTYRVAGWASVVETESAGAPVWEPLQDYLIRRGTVNIKSVNIPKLR
ncbi:MAG: thiosulfohydrolase SoxB [Betaproteobacteria bacterium]|nr:thiosulfohydrolase SoxB [Betaproteobacteria bacterium]